MTLFFLLLLTLGAIGTFVGLKVDRIAVENSRQYAESNTAAFYDRLEAVGVIDTQLAGLPNNDPLVPGSAEPEDAPRDEMRREVAKIPHDARTADADAVRRCPMKRSSPGCWRCFFPF